MYVVYVITYIYIYIHTRRDGVKIRVEQTPCVKKNYEKKENHIRSNFFGSDH
jgi:hypothetical protein